MKEAVGANMNTWLVGRVPVAHFVNPAVYAADGSLRARGKKVFSLQVRIMTGQAVRREVNRVKQIVTMGSLRRRNGVVRRVVKGELISGPLLPRENGVEVTPQRPELAAHHACHHTFRPDRTTANCPLTQADLSAGGGGGRGQPPRLRRLD